MAVESLKNHQIGTPGHSLALKYELVLQGLEGGGAPSLERINTCFEVLDEVIPGLGIYRHVMELMKKEFQLAVYSMEWTSHPRRKAAFKAGKASLIGLPYFVIAQRLTEKKSGEHSKLKNEISSLKEQFYTCEADLEKAVSSLEVYRHDLKEKEAKIHQVTSELRVNRAEREQLEKIISQNKNSQERACQEFDFRMFSLRNTIANQKMENSHLKVFKHTHDQLQAAPFLSPAPTTTTTNTVQYTTKTEMEQHLLANEKIKCQLLTLQNSIIDELDSWLQVVYSPKNPISPEDMVQKRKSFKKQVLAISKELSLLDQHSCILKERLNQLSSEKKGSAEIALVLPSHSLNPLISQEQVFSRYAAMIYTSSGGTDNFYPLKIAQDCLNCGQKTVICPHKTFEREMIVQLPVNCSHLKISRPDFQLPRQDKPFTLHSEPSKALSSLPNSQRLHVAVPDYGYLWTQFKSKFSNFNIQVPRKLSQEQLMMLVELFYATLFLQDEREFSVDQSSNDSDDGSDGNEEDELPLSFPETLFEFMDHHYSVNTPSSISSYAFISSLEELYSQNKEVLVLSHALCGDLDGSAVRYMLVQSCLVEAVTWVAPTQIPIFLAHLYPFLGEEGIEQMTLDFTAHSNNQLSTLKVVDFLQFILLRHKDPLVLKLEGLISEHPCQQIGTMLEVEFAEAMESLLPANTAGQDGVLCSHLFLQSLSVYRHKTSRKTESLPTRTLSYIAAYLHRSTGLEKMKRELSQKMLTAATSASPPERSDKRLHTMESVQNIIIINKKVNNF